MSDDITALRHYVARLEDDLAIADNDLESLRRYSSKQALDIIMLGQEVGRLREALQEAIEWDGYDEENVEAVWLEQARAALAEKEEK